MKKTNIFTAFLICLTLGFLASGCKDFLNPNKCKLASLNAKDQQFMRCVYDSKDRITKLNIIPLSSGATDTFYYSYTYKGDSMIESLQVGNNGAIDVSRRYKLNGSGRIQSYKVELSATVRLEYNLAGYLVKKISENNGSAILITYTIKDGNYTAEEMNVDGKITTISYEYYSDKKNPETGISRTIGGFANFDYGKQDKNLLKKETKTNSAGVVTTTEYSYELDSEGNVLKETAVVTQNQNSATWVRDFTYNCE